MELKTQCPKCGNNVQHQGPSLDLDGQFSCVACGHSAQFGDFLTAETRNRILEAAKQEWVKSLAGIPGFKAR
ncbi:hypothetical protein BN2497_10467 [Janthinobacterium sp. CG23_2]|nr:hypothetical protein BN2497_10467 [Janthinobacterium sp. CG23_2]CUU31631.1 hypothetical protein BN3177_10467 [Janthinobacterium sp. CG23_2]